MERVSGFSRILATGAPRCLACGKPSGFTKQRPVHPRKFCTRACRVGSHTSNWRGGRYLVGKGYIRVNLSRNRSQYEHRVIAASILGRALKPTETVHHVNGNKADNQNKNLVICTNAYHRWLHEEMARRYIVCHFPQVPRQRQVA